MIKRVGQVITSMDDVVRAILTAKRNVVAIRLCTRCQQPFIVAHAKERHCSDDCRIAHARALAEARSLKAITTREKVITSHA